MKSHLTIREAFGIDHLTTDLIINRDALRDRIKSIAGRDLTYDEIVQAMSHVYRAAFQKKQEKAVMGIEPGLPGFVLCRNDGVVTVRDEVRHNLINFKDFEVQLKELLEDDHYKQPRQKRERDAGDQLTEPLKSDNVDD